MTTQAVRADGLRVAAALAALAIRLSGKGLSPLPGRQCAADRTDEPDAGFARINLQGLFIGRSHAPM